MTHAVPKAMASDEVLAGETVVAESVPPVVAASVTAAPVITAAPVMPEPEALINGDADPGYMPLDIDSAPLLYADEVSVAVDNAQLNSSQDRARTPEWPSNAVLESPAVGADAVDDLESAHQGAQKAVPQENLEGEFDWYNVFSQLPNQGLLTSIASHMEYVKTRGECLYFRLDQTQSALYNEDMKDNLAKTISDYLCKNIELDVSIQALSNESPAMRNQRLAKERYQQQLTQFQQQPQLQLLIKAFDGVLNTSSVVVLADLAQRS